MDTDHCLSKPCWPGRVLPAQDAGDRMKPKSPGQYRKHAQRHTQYTLRGVPADVDRCLREAARQEGTSLNEAALAALRRGLCMQGTSHEYHDLDACIGTWQEDAEFDRFQED